MLATQASHHLPEIISHGRKISRGSEGKCCCKKCHMRESPLRNRMAIKLPLVRTDPCSHRKKLYLVSFRKHGDISYSINKKTLVRVRGTEIFLEELR